MGVVEGEGGENNMSEIDVLVLYITLLWVIGLVLIEYWILTLKKEKREAKTT